MNSFERSMTKPLLIEKKSLSLAEALEWADPSLSLHDCIYNAFLLNPSSQKGEGIQNIRSRESGQTRGHEPRIQLLHS